MGTFTITQTQVGKNLYIHPIADGCNIDFTPVGEANNWKCVDDIRENPDDDSTYVYSDATDLKYDLYELQNHTTETGTINYIQAYVRSKSHQYPQSIDGIFKIILTEDVCSNIYKSDDIDLTTGYLTYNNIWLENPRSSVTWTWDDIDNLQIGLECSSPTNYAIEKTLTLRPNAVGALTQLKDYPVAGNNYDKVDETSPDNYNTFVYNNTKDAAWRDDLYGLPNHTTETGTITKISVFYVWKKERGSENCWGRYDIKIGAGATINGADVALVDWETTSYDFFTNPDTGVAWTWGNIDDLQMGVGFKVPVIVPNQQGTCTQAYVVVYYLEDASPEIRTTQVYAKVNYDLDVTCTIQKPAVITVDHNQITKMLNFWSGNRAVYGEHRGGRVMAMNGIQYSEDACEIMECVRDMAEAGDIITTTQLGTTEFNNTFRIISFGYKKRSEKPLVFDWMLELEYTE